MKKVFTIIAAVLLVASVFAQAPQKMSYQAVVRNANDNLLANTNIGMQISILQDSAGGSAVYIERHFPTTNTNGLVRIEIGTGTIVTGDFTTIGWANGPYFIKTETDPAGDTSYTITGTNQLLSVPYALHAKSAETVTGGGGFTPCVGDLYGGGIIVLVWEESGVKHGLIASLTDVSASAEWSSNYSFIGVAAQSLIDGEANTTAIVAHGDVSGAAFLCDNYSSGGFYDWYLPSSWELNQCFNAAFVVNTILGATDGFQYADYWSSTENAGINSDGALGQDFFNGNLLGGHWKTNTLRVRAVRRF